MKDATEKMLKNFSAKVLPHFRFFPHLITAVLGTTIGFSYATSNTEISGSGTADGNSNYITVCLNDTSAGGLFGSRHIYCERFTRGKNKIEDKIEDKNKDNNKDKNNENLVKENWFRFVRFESALHSDIGPLEERYYSAECYLEKQTLEFICNIINAQGKDEVFKYTLFCTRTNIEGELCATIIRQALTYKKANNIEERIEERIENIKQLAERFKY
ncbi:MAG: hypothetical protein DRP09_21990 [Candidatus Thorarchaeota archaeon]|nr:MAG: hypothetical protein DRP09_21990 [Candidatus Thorarchaeota archaeon]